MAIQYNETAGTFTLTTNTSTYQIKADRHGVLLHTYFGTRTDESDLAYLIAPADHGFSGQPGDVTDRTYSLDYYPLEYPVQGNGDYRVTACRAGLSGSVPALDLRYVSHEIRQGKYALRGLPAMFEGNEEAADACGETSMTNAHTAAHGVDTLEILLKDLHEEIYVRLLYGVFEKSGMITRAAVIENHTKKSLELRRAMSFGMDFMDCDLELIHFAGKHTLERQPERTVLTHGITEIESHRGTSSHQHNPFVILCDPHTTEERGSCYGISLLYSGSYRMVFEKDAYDSLRVAGGIHDEDFRWEMCPGETFYTPEAAFFYSGQGFGELSRGIAQAYHRHLIRSPWKDRRRPILVNNWEATYFDFDAKKLLALSEQAADIGLDMLVLDDGWFGKRDSDNAGLGDWNVNEEKLGCTLKELADRVRALGLSFGIWMEPEMISQDSDLYRTHPEWTLQIPGRLPGRSRDQLCLDLSRREVREYVEAGIDATLNAADISYVKWDINRSIDNLYSAADPTLQPGALRHKLVLGLYRLLEDMLEKHPDLLLEGCNGGGGRFDAGMLYYAPQIWCSDNTDAIERLKIHYGTSFGYPMSSVSAHVSVCPNHQNGRVTPFATRGVCAMQGAFGYELDLGRLSMEELAEAKKQIAFYREHAALFGQGTYYRLSSPFENRDFTAWSYVAPDRSEAVLAVVYTDQHANPKPLRVKLAGLDPEASYRVTGSPVTGGQSSMEGGNYTGAALMRGGFVLPLPEQNYDSYMAMIQRA